MSDFLYAIGGTVGIIGLVTAVLVGAASKAGEGATVRDRILSSSALTPLLIIHYFLPYALIVLVFFMDIMSQLPQAIFGLIFAIVALVGNYLLSGNLYKNEVFFPNDLCEIPGLKGMASVIMPQSLLFVTTIVTYLASFTTTTVLTNSQGAVPAPGDVLTLTPITPSPMTRIGASWGLAAAVILFQTVGLLTTPGCLTNMKAFGNFSAAAAILLGAAIGGGAGYGFATMITLTQPSYSVNAPVRGVPPTTQATKPGFIRERFQLGAGLGEMPMPPAQGEAPTDIAKSSGAVTPGESSDQFVCEAYKNGQLVTTTLVD